MFAKCLVPANFYFILQRYFKFQKDANKFVTKYKIFQKTFIFIDKRIFFECFSMFRRLFPAIC